MFTAIKKKIREFTPKQLVVAGVFTLALAGSIGLGLVTKQLTNAAVIRDCDTNSIDNQNLNGGCGAANPAELIKDIQGKKPADLSMIYDHFGLTPGKYDKFVKEAQQGTLFRDGHIEVNGQTVMTGAWTMGREKFNAQREAYQIKNNTYYHSAPSSSFGSGTNSLPVMVLFTDDGSVDVAVINACGNPITKGNKVKSGATCDMLNMTAVAGKENTYSFTTNVTKTGNASIAKVEYYIDGKLWKTETDPKKAVQNTFTKSATVSVKVYVKLPGNKQIFVESAKCKRQVDVKVKEIFYVCKALIATARDNTNRKFRFTVNTDQSTDVKVKDVDFTLDGKVTTTGVTTKDSKGNIYKDYDFTDAVEHTISAKVNFTHDGKTVTAKEACVAKVTPEKPPVCPHNPNLPPEHPECKAPECVEKPGSGLPPGHPDCKKQEVQSASTTLPKTGPAAGIVGLFAGASIAGSAAHRLFLRYRGRE